ncbi:Rod shape-determining protein MreD [Halioglobus japonicus]|nr:Rod shape-determining protein MreD [Halioglobus japonicus]
MASREGQGYAVIILTFILAYVLAVVPLPEWLQWGRPEWVALTLIYWCIALPQRVGIAAALILGVGLDVLEGSVLGQNAFALVVVALLSQLLYQRLRVYSLWQQAVVVFILVGINQLICQWVQSIEGVSVLPRLFLLPALSSALLWPVILHSLRSLRRYYQVT